MFDKTKTVAWIAVAILVLVGYLAYTQYQKPVAV
jgi:hypothetical protein